MIIFTAEDHKYESIDTENKINWISVTSLVSLFKLPFEKEEIAQKCSINKKSKWYGLTPEKILEHWGNTNKTALNLGSWYHDQREQDTIACDTIQRLGKDLSIVKPLIDGDKKIAPDQSMVEGIYPEHMVYLESAGVCGQADRVEVVQDTLNVFDYKTNKEIKMKGFKSWQGIVTKMLHVCSHLDECNYNHYALQLSIYMYIMLKHNPNLKAGRIVLEHIKFEIDSVDEWDNPLYAYDAQGDPIVKEVKTYELPYLKKEVQRMFEYYKKNGK
tara:strand:- start:417 stop:1232 length:816 start_codon:yes stop_codon:yes gene_type:complete